MELFTQYDFINIETGLRRTWYVADMLTHINLNTVKRDYDEHNWREGLVRYTEWRLVN